MSVSSHRHSGFDDDLAPVTILLVDDDEHWAWATAQLLEHEAEFAVEVAHSLAAGRDRFDGLDPDCVVCDYDLGDGTGLELLDTVCQADADRPFVLVTGKGDEVVASTAIERGVTDYIRKGRDDEDEILASRIRNLVRAYRSERALDRQQRTKTAVLDVLRETANETELCQEFCRQLVDTEPCALAWIGTTVGPTGLRPRASAGRDQYLDALLMDGDIPGGEPARVAAHRVETVVTAVDADDATGAWSEIAAEHEFHTGIAVPIRYDGVDFGVLAVYLEGASTATLDASEITEYAESIGYALRSIDRKRSLLSAQPVRVDVTVTDPAAPLVAVARQTASDVRITCPSVVTRSDGTTVYLAYVTGVQPGRIDDAVSNRSDLTVLDTDTEGDQQKWTVAVSEQTPEGTVVDHGAQFEQTVVEDGTATISIHVREDKAVSEIADAVEQRFDGTSVSTVWTDDHSRSSPTDPFDDLTDKQRTVLRHAFHEGYFERPRDANASEISERLGISRQTFAQHLRAAQRKVLDTWQPG